MSEACLETASLADVLSVGLEFSARDVSVVCGVSGFQG